MQYVTHSNYSAPIPAVTFLLIIFLFPLWFGWRCKPTPLLDRFLTLGDF